MSLEKLEQDKIYKLKNAKDDSEFKEVYVIAEASSLVIVKSHPGEKEASISREQFCANYEEKGFEDLSAEEKVKHIYVKSTFALTALTELSKSLPETALSNPNLALLNNTLHELTLVSSPIVLPAVAEYRESLKSENETAVLDQGISFLDIEKEVA